MRGVVMFSGGAASWGTARRIVDEGRVDDFVLVFTDTKTEDEDLYRFLDEAAADIGVPLINLADGRDIWEVFRDERYLGNTRVDPCSKILKRNLAKTWMEANRDPADTILYLGLDWTEVHRLETAAARWVPWRVESPLTEPPFRMKQELMEDLRERGIEPPRLYGLGFAHNNCGGGCVKAGQSQFRHLLEVLPDRFAEWEAGEEGIRQHLGKDVSILRDMTGGTTKPLTLKRLRERIEAGATIPMFDIGGCACFEEPEGEDE